MKIVKTQSLLMIQVIKYAEKLLGKALMRKFIRLVTSHAGHTITSL